MQLVAPHAEPSQYCSSNRTTARADLRLPQKIVREDTLSAGGLVEKIGSLRSTIKDRFTTVDKMVNGEYLLIAINGD